MGRLRTEEFSNMAYFIQPMESLPVGLTVDGHGHIGFKPGTLRLRALSKGWIVETSTVMESTVRF